MNVCVQSSSARTDAVRNKLRASMEGLLADTEFIAACAELPERFERLLEDFQWRRQTILCVAKEKRLP